MLRVLPGHMLSLPGSRKDTLMVGLEKVAAFFYKQFLYCDLAEDLFKCAFFSPLSTYFLIAPCRTRSSLLALTCGKYFRKVKLFHLWI